MKRWIAGVAVWGMAVAPAWSCPMCFNGSEVPSSNIWTIALLILFFSLAVVVVAIVRTVLRMERNKLEHDRHLGSAGPLR